MFFKGCDSPVNYVLVHEIIRLVGDFTFPHLILSIFLAIEVLVLLVAIPMSMMGRINFGPASLVVKPHDHLGD